MVASALSAPFVWAQPVTGVWGKTSGGNWSDPLNWSGGVPGGGANVPAGTDDVAEFLKAITSSSTITLNGDRTIGTLHFDNASAYTVSGTSTLSFSSSSGSASLAVTAVNGKGSHVVNVSLRLLSPLDINVASAGASVQLNKPISDDGNGRGLTFDGPGVVTFGGSGDNSYGGPTLVNAGTVALTRSGRVIPGALFIGNGAAPATVQVRAQINPANIGDVTVAPGIGSLTNSGTFDVGGANISSLSGGGIVKGTQLWISGSNSTTFSGTFQFGDFYKTGSSTLTLTGTNNSFVSFYLSGGRVILGGNGALARGDLYVNDPLFVRGEATGVGNVVLEAATPFSTTNRVFLRNTMTFDGTSPMKFGALTLFSNSTLAVNADTTFGAVGDNFSSSGLTKTGPGTLTIGIPGVASGYSGPTVVTGGTLKLANGAFGSSSYTLNNAMLDVSAGGTNATLAVPLTGVSSTVVGSLNVQSSISGTNLTLGDLQITTNQPPSVLNGSLIAGNLHYRGSQTIAAGTVISGTGTVTVDGFLVVHGQVNKPFDVTGTLWGQGNITGAVDVHKVGTHAGLIGAGNISLPCGTLSTGSLTLESGAFLEAGIGATNASTINVTGSVNLAGSLFLQLQGAPSSDSAFLVINNDGNDPINGAFSNLPDDGTPLIIHAPGVDYIFTANYHYDAGRDGGNNDVALTMTTVATPEPSGIAALGLLMIRGTSRRPRRSIDNHERSV